MAQAFDADALELTGDAFPIVERVQVNPLNGRVAFGVSENGVLAYRSTGNLNTQLAWFDRSGKELSQIGEPGGYISPKLSPDEKQIAVTRTTDPRAPGDIWVFDLSRNTQTRLTFDAAEDSSPIWSPDGSRIAFASRQGNAFGLYQKNSNGIGAEELLLKTSAYAIPEDWSLDGRYLVYMSTEGGGRDVLVLPLTSNPGQAGSEGSKPVPFLQTQFLERHAKLSPDGRWMAYSSNESGQYQIYVQTFPTGSGKWQVSTTGGVQPRWRHDGRELFFLTADGKLMVVPVRAGATFEAGTPALLFQTQSFGLAPAVQYSQQYDVAADGQRFLINVDLTEATAAPITVVLNWQKAVTSGK
jgi:Tol biopolymer transport system component